MRKLSRNHDLLFALVISFGIILFWRGVWGLLDIYLFPANLETSFWIFAIAGVGILIVTGYMSKSLR
ncbi:MAG: hypothetical protein J4431_00670 [Candidatus Aenigmarchaeota archaeon]|nr:hypothetical protein [Candidatus Aenigmarchaeota archaeon]